MVKINITDLNKLELVSKKLAYYIKPSYVVTLDGELGAGKTTTTQYLLKELGIDEYITSPTFNIINQYSGKYTINHFDVYRIENEDELFEIGFEEYIYSDNISIIEWSSLIEYSLPEERLKIDIIFENGNRNMIIEGMGEQYQFIEKEISKEC